MNERELLAVALSATIDMLTRINALALRLPESTEAQQIIDLSGTELFSIAAALGETPERTADDG